MGKFSVADDVVKAFDELPIHMRQLADMFRKHNVKQGVVRTDIDATDIASARKVDGWKGDWTPNDVIDAGHGDRPDPDAYLDKSYIDNHLARFDNGGSRIYFKDGLSKYGPGQWDGTTFVFPKDELQRVLDESGGDARKLATLLGWDEDAFIDKSTGLPVEIEIRNFEPSELDGLRMPSGNEAGANEHWIPGGFLPTGIPEAVIDIPAYAQGWDAGGIPQTGQWPGTAQGFTLR